MRMTSDQYRDIVGELFRGEHVNDLGLGRAAECFGIDISTSQRYASGLTRIPIPLAKLLKAMVKYNLPPEAIEKL